MKDDSSDPDKPFSDPLSTGGPDFQSLLGNDRRLRRQLRAFDPLNLAASFASLLTVPQLQANCYRLEALVHLALGIAQGSQVPSATIASLLFSKLGEGIAGSMEDPAEDIFVSSVATPRGNFLILEGMWDSAGFYLQRIINTLERLPDERPFTDIRSKIYALLRVSDLLCQKAGLGRNELGNEAPLRKIPHDVLSVFRARSAIVAFSKSELGGKDVVVEDLVPFCFDLNDCHQLARDKIGASRLERSPLVVCDQHIYVLLPTAISVAIRHFVLECVDGIGLKEFFLGLLSQDYAGLFERIPFFGGRSDIRIVFQRTENSFISGVMRPIDDGIYMNVVFYLDCLADFQETGFGGVGPINSPLASDLQVWVDHAYETASKSEGFRQGLTLLVACGVGRGLAVRAPRIESSDWRVELVAAHDFHTLGWLPKFKPLSLLRLLEAEEELQNLGVRLFNLNGLLNQVAWMRFLKGHLVPHGHLPEELGTKSRFLTIMVEQNGLRRLRSEVAKAFDPHVAESAGGIWIPVRKTGDSFFEEDAIRPFYVTEENISRWPWGVFETSARTWWCELITTADTSGHVAYERSKMPFNWLCRAAPVLESALPSLPLGALLWRLNFTSQLGAELDTGNAMRSSYEDALASIAVDVSHSEATVTLIVEKAFERALFHPENIAERALVARFVEGCAVLAAERLSPTEQDELVSRIVPDTFARQTHVFRARSFRDYLRDRAPKALAIDEDNEALIKLGLGWRVREWREGGDIRGKEACTKYLNAVVAFLEDDVCKELQQYDRREVLSFALRHYEGGAVERDQWRRTTAALLSLHDDKDAVRQTLAEHDYRLNAVFQALRLVLGFSLCECPIDGGRIPGELEFSRIMSKLLLISGLGGWSDAIHYEVMEPHIRVTPLGDIHANLSFEDKILAPYGRAGSDVRVDDDVRRYGKHYDEPIALATDESPWPDTFWQAFPEEFGASFDEVRTFIDYVENLGLECGTLVLSVKRSALLAIRLEEKTVPLETAERLVSNLTLPRRVNWRTVPPGYLDKDRFPWRYRRSLSILRKPLLQLDDGHDPTILVAPGLLRETFVYMLAGYHGGNFPLHQLKPKMAAWAGQQKNRVGHDFNEIVANRLRELGWQTKIEIKPTEILNRKLPKDYGDVDVVAWNADAGRILMIECKDLQYRKALGEIAEQLADYRGGLRADGKPDELRRHLDRVDILRSDPGAVCGYLKIREAAIESHLVFKNPVPMQYALEKLKERVRVNVFADLDQL